MQLRAALRESDAGDQMMPVLWQLDAIPASRAREHCVCALGGWRWGWRGMEEDGGERRAWERETLLGNKQLGFRSFAIRHSFFVARTRDQLA